MYVIAGILDDEMKATAEKRRLVHLGRLLRRRKEPGEDQVGCTECKAISVSQRLAK